MHRTGLYRLSVISAYFSFAYRKYVKMNVISIFCASDKLHAAALELKMQCIHIVFTRNRQTDDV